MATLAQSLIEGAYGFSGICANFYPRLISSLCKNPKNERLRRFVTLAEAVIANKYPQSAKIYLNRHILLGKVTDLCRGGRMWEWKEEEVMRLDVMYAMAVEMERELEEGEGR